MTLKLGTSIRVKTAEEEFSAQEQNLVVCSNFLGQLGPLIQCCLFVIQKKVNMWRSPLLMKCSVPIKKWLRLK